MKEKWQPKVAAFSEHPVEYLRRERKKRQGAWRCRNEWGQSGTARKGNGLRDGERRKETGGEEEEEGKGEEGEE